MIEVIGENLELAFKELDVNAIKTYEQGEKDVFQLYSYQVWEMDEENFNRLNKVDKEKWKDEWGWLSFKGYENRDYSGELYEYTVNGYKMLGYIPDKYEQEAEELELEEEDKELTLNWYKYIESRSFIDWMEEVLHLSKPGVIACFAISLAKENNMRLWEFMKKYQP